MRTAAKRRLIALAAAFAAAAALCLIEPAAAMETEGRAPVSGVRLTGALDLSPLAAPALPNTATIVSPSLSQPSPLASLAASPVASPVAAPAVLAAGSPSADPHAAETPRPAGASAGLQSVARSLAQEQSRQEPSQEAAPSAASRAFFDGGLTKTVQAAAVVAGAVTPGGFGMPATYALARYTSERAELGAAKEANRVPLGQRLGQQASAQLAFLAMSFPALLVHKLFEGSPLLMSLAAVLLAYAGAAGVESMLGEARRRVVGGWQASHDQKYRHDLTTGKLVDIRGKKYGEDRYEEYERGPVSAGERLWARLAATGFGALLLSSWSGEYALIYSAALTAAFALGDALAARRSPAPERVFSDEERAHAARFLRD